MQQLLLFEVEKDVNKDFEKLNIEWEKKWEKTRKSLYARLTESNKKYNELQHEFEVLKLNICKGKIVS